MHARASCVVVTMCNAAVAPAAAACGVQRIGRQPTPAGTCSLARVFVPGWGVHRRSRAALLQRRLGCARTVGHRADVVLKVRNLHILTPACEHANKNPLRCYHCSSQHMTSWRQRTMPVPWVAVGGVATFHAVPARGDALEGERAKRLELVSAL
jgi:hypothetical protein